uniref:Uncharacterized protein n=1 Tax=Aegilops tauschii TaxID=37682 RepID=R7VYY6_AEGTA
MAEAAREGGHSHLRHGFSEIFLEVYESEASTFKCQIKLPVDMDGKVAGQIQV